MISTQLRQRLGRHIQTDLQSLYERYVAEHPAEDVDGFVAHLVAAGHLDPAAVREIYAETEIEIAPAQAFPTPVGPPAATPPTLVSRSGGTRASAPPGPDAGTRPGGEVETVIGGFTGPSGSASTAPPPVQESRYAPIARLGQGAMGAIDVARDIHLRRRVALKTVLPAMAAHQALLDRFLAEMQITAQLEHPNIVPVYAIEVGADGALGYAMKLVHGKDLAQLLAEARDLVRAGTPLPSHLALDQRLAIFLEVCNALEYAHARGIVHRDLKPSNVMVGEHHEVYLMDWGIARPMGAGGQAIDAGIELAPTAGDPLAARTRVGSTVGTPAYMSPEQAAGRNHELDGRSDLYTMGLILQEIVTLAPAVRGKTLEEVLTKAREARRDPVGDGVVPGGMSRELEAIVRRATARSPADRYPSVRALADEVRRVMRDEPIEALPDGASRKVTRWVGRHRAKALALMLSIGLLGAVATIVTQRVGQARLDALHASEIRQSELEIESAIAAQRIDRKLTRYEVALARLAGAAQAALSSTASDAGTAYFVEDLHHGGGAPPDFAPSRRHGQPISVLAPVVGLAPGASRDEHGARARSLSTALAPAFREALLDTAGVRAHGISPAMQRAHIADTGTPALGARLVLASGLTLSFPASVGAAATDPGSDAAYQASVARPGVHWSSPVQRGATSVLPVSTAVYEGDALRGVVVLEIATDELLEDREPGELEYVQTHLLLGRDGTVRGERSRAGGRAPLSREVVDAVAAGKSGSVEYDGEGRRWMATYYSLTALDWSFVSIADMGRMLATTRALVSSDARAATSGAATPSASLAVAPPPPPAAPSSSAELVPSASAAPVSSAAPLARGGPVPRPPAPVGATSAEPSAAPAASVPPNPFDKWDAYKK